MPIVPVEENKVGIAGLTDAKLRPADYSGSGLEALGAGLAGVGKAGAELADSLPGQEEARRRHAALLRTDHAAKQAWNDGHEANGALLDGYRQLKGKEARAALAPVAEAMAQNLDAVRRGQEDEHVRAIIDGTLAHRTAQDITDLHAHADAQDAIAQAQESERVIANSAADALRHVDDPTRFDHAIATGENTLRRQGQLAGKPEAAIDDEIAVWRSARYVQAVHALAPSDGLGATALFERYRDQLTPADRAGLEPLLHEPMAQTQAIADIDTAALAAAPFAPLTPQGDPLLADRMRTITSHFDRVVLPELMQRYGGDAARAWAATQIGTDAVDDLVKQHGDGWYQALPEAARNAVAHNFALLRADSSARTAPQDRAAVEASLAGLNDTRRGYAQRELTLRSNRADQARRAAQGAAADQAYELADQLGHDFTSLAQLPAKVRADLSNQTSTALQRQADANIDPHPVAPEGAVSLALRNMAATAPEAFREIDMREYRPLVSADEYAMFQRLQRATQSDREGSGIAEVSEPSPSSTDEPRNAAPIDELMAGKSSPDGEPKATADDLLDPKTLAALQAAADVETTGDAASAFLDTEQPGPHDLLSPQLISALDAAAARETGGKPRANMALRRRRPTVAATQRPRVAAPSTPQADAPFARSLRQLARTISPGTAPEHPPAPGLLDRLDQRAGAVVNDRVKAIEESLRFDYGWIAHPRAGFETARKTFNQLFRKGTTPVTAAYVLDHPAQFPGKVLTLSYGSNVDKGVVDAGQFATDQISGDYITVGLDATHPRLPKIPNASVAQRIVREMAKNSSISFGLYQDIQSFAGHALTASGGMAGVSSTMSQSLNGPHMKYSGFADAFGITDFKKRLPHGTAQRTFTVIFNVKGK